VHIFEAKIMDDSSFHEHQVLGDMLPTGSVFLVKYGVQHFHYFMRCRNHIQSRMANIRKMNATHSSYLCNLMIYKGTRTGRG
jgi:hypothetical protein